MWVLEQIAAAVDDVVAVVAVDSASLSHQLMMMWCLMRNSAGIDPHLSILMMTDSRDETPPHLDHYYYSADDLYCFEVDDDSDPAHEKRENWDSMKSMDWSTGSGDTGAEDMRMSNACPTTRNNVNPASYRSPCLTSW